MKFLDNEICIFEPVNNKHLLDNKINMISSVFFKREQYYKNFGIYVKGLKRAIKYFDERNDRLSEKFIYVIFIDQNIYEDDEIMQLIKNSKYTVPILFKCVKYMVGKYHLDLFGTLVRFFPIFDFPNNPAGLVCIVDIDLHEEDYIRLEACMTHKPIGLSGPAQIIDLLLKDDDNHAYIYANSMFYNADKFDHNFIIDFIKKADTFECKGCYGKRDTTFGFGIDEIFINNYFIPKLEYYNAIIEYEMSYLLYHSKDFIFDSKHIDYTTKLLGLILGKFNDTDLGANKKMEIIDLYTYLIRLKTEETNELSKNYSFIIKCLAENNKKWIPKPFIDFIYKYLLNIISAIVVISIKYNQNQSQIQDVIKYDVIYDDHYGKNIETPELSCHNILSKSE